MEKRLKYGNFLIVGAFTLMACSVEEDIAPIAPAARRVAAPAITRAAAAAAVTYVGVLGPGVRILEDGEYMERFTFHWNAGESHVVHLASAEFDPYVIVVPPGRGAQLDNDNLADGSTDAGLTVTCATTGEYTVVVISLHPGEAGAFTLTIR